MIQWFDRLSVRRKFLAIGLFLLPFLAGLGGAGAWGVMQINGVLQQDIQDQIPRIYTISQVTADIHEVYNTYRQALLETDPQAIQTALGLAQISQNRVRTNWAAYKNLPNGEDEHAIWARFDKTLAGWQTETATVARLAQENTPEAKAQAEHLLDNGSELDLADVASFLADQNNTDTKTTAADAQATYNTVMGILLICAVFVLLVNGGSGVLLASSISRMTGALARVNTELQHAFSNIERKRQMGQNVVERVQSVSAELTAMSAQQASGSQQQVAALTQAISTLSELSQTAEHIATKAAQIDEATTEVLSSTAQVTASATTVAEVGEHGQQSTQSTIAINTKVNTIYQGLVQLLLALLERSSKLREVNALMRAISDETHLLSLNAAIEAAGAGAEGMRFAVVANAVKNLSDRSVSASQEVASVLSDLESRIQQAVLTAESGARDTQMAVAIAQENGAIIQELMTAIGQNMTEVTKIAQVVQMMTALTQEIRYATQQQSNSARQSAQTLQEIGLISRQTATGSQQVTDTANDLTNLSNALQLTLAA